MGQAGQRVVIVGAGIGAVRTAESLRRAGFDGAIVVLGAERELPYDRPPLSKDVLLGARDLDGIVLRSEDKLAELGLELRLGVEAGGLDLARRRVETATGGEKFDHLVIATGSTARSLPVLAGVAGVSTLRTIGDARALRDALARAGDLLVVGAGFIGAEVASAARALGVAATVVELDEAPLSRVLGREVGAALAGLHDRNGTTLRLGVSIERVEPSASGPGRVHLTDGSALEPDVVVVGVGATPAVDWLAGTEIEVGNGVVCDAWLRTSVPAVYAIGDVCNWRNELFARRMRVEHWTNASEQAAHVARMITGANPEPFRGSNFVWSDQYGVRIQFVGIATDDVVVVDGALGDERYVAWYREEGRLVGALAVNAPRELMKSRKLVEAQAGFDAALDELTH
jgi:NADPH-dependent 2,4-dienoyl-CoA reductase/sulfur reductase-like enzyme